MKKNIILLIAAIVLTACSENEEQSVTNTMVNLTFTPYEMTGITRATTSISTYCTHLDIWLTEGTETQSYHQTSDDVQFGSISLSLNRLKTYTLIAVAHKCASDATLTDGIIAFPDDKVTHSMVYTTTFTPSTTTTINCVMQRIVGWFRLEIADAVPSDVTKIVYTIPSTYNRWNVTSSAAANQLDRTGTINLTSVNSDGTANINLYVMPSSLTATDHYDITISAQTSTDEVIEEKAFASVPIRADYKTTYHGQFFTTETMTMTFTANDWQTFETTEF